MVPDLQDLNQVNNQPGYHHVKIPKLLGKQQFTKDIEGINYFVKDGINYIANGLQYNSQLRQRVSELHDQVKGKYLQLIQFYKEKMHITLTIKVILTSTLNIQDLVRDVGTEEIKSQF